MPAKNIIHISFAGETKREIHLSGGLKEREKEREREREREREKRFYGKSFYSL